MGQCRINLIGMLLLGLLDLSAGCDRAPAKAPVPVEKVSIIATVYPLADVARNVGGPYVSTSWIIESGQSLAGVQSSTETRNRLRSAGLVVSGGASEPWASEGYNDPVQAQRIIRMDLLPAVHANPQPGLLWMDPVLVEDLCREIDARLTVLRPKIAQALDERQVDYAAQIDALVKEYQPKLDNAKQRNVLVLSTDFNPLLVRFHLTPIVVTQATPTQMSDMDWSLLRKAVREHDTRLLLVPADTPAVVIRDLEQRAGVQAVPIDALGSSAPAGRNSYLEIMRYDLDQLVSATAL